MDNKQFCDSYLDGKFYNLKFNNSKFDGYYFINGKGDVKDLEFAVEIVKIPPRLPITMANLGAINYFTDIISSTLMDETFLEFLKELPGEELTGDTNPIPYAFNRDEIPNFLHRSYVLNAPPKC
jgi:hypothetical protein